MNSTDDIYEKRIQCYHNTTRIAKQQYPLIKESIKYKYDSNFTWMKKYNTIIKVVNGDTIDTALIFTKKHYSPLVLNLADDCMPGGLVEAGSGAQEESLFRRSNYFISTRYERRLYPIKFNEAIYSPKITVFKDNEENKWKLYKQPYLMDFIACPGLKYPTLINGTDTKNNITIQRLKSKDVEMLKNKIRLIFQIGYKHKNDVLILGALGCGAWCSPPEHVAEIFNEICNEYSGMFKYIIFAILRGAGDTNKKQLDNYDIFSKIITQG